MVYDWQVVENSNVLAYCDYLQKNHRQPTIAIYRGKTVMVTSYRADHFLGKIYQIFLRAKSHLFYFFGLLKDDNGMFLTIKTQVENYHFKKCKGRRATEIQNNIQSIRDEIKKEIKDALSKDDLLGKTEKLIDQFDAFLTKNNLVNKK